MDPSHIFTVEFSGFVFDQVLSFDKYDLGYFHGLKLTRTASKLFITDELDERELAFAWEDRDIIIDQLNR